MTNDSVVGTFQDFKTFKSEIDRLDEAGSNGRKRPEAEEARYQLLLYVETLTSKSGRHDLLPALADFTRSELQRVEAALALDDLDSAVSEGPDKWSTLETKELALMLRLLRVTPDRIHAALSHNISNSGIDSM